MHLPFLNLPNDDFTYPAISTSDLTGNEFRLRPQAGVIAATPGHG